MSQAQPSSFEAIKTKREEFESYRRQLISSLERCNYGNRLEDIIKSNSSPKSDIIKELEKTINKLETIIKATPTDKAFATQIKMKIVNHQYLLIHCGQRRLKKTFSELWRLYHDAIINQGAEVRKLRPIRAAEAVERLESLKADYKADTGIEWSEVKEENVLIINR